MRYLFKWYNLKNMKSIIISEKDFNKIFDEVLFMLELKNLREKDLHRGHELKAEELHRTFHYEICCLKERLEKA